MRGILRPNGGNYETQCGNEVTPVQGILRPLARTRMIVDGSGGGAEEWRE